jgi:hypothetical protein
MGETRDLDADEVALLERILAAASVDVFPELSRQVPYTTVRGGIPTLLDLAVDPSAPVAQVDNGPLPIRALVVGPHEEPRGEVLVWISDGYLSGLEYAWVTDDVPTGMPSADSVHLIDANV